MSWHVHMPLEAQVTIEFHVGLDSLVSVLVHEFVVSLGKALESLVHGLFGGEEGRTEVQGSLLLPETTPRHENDA